MTNEHDHQRKPSDHENMQVPLHLNARRVPRTTGQSFQGMAKKIFKIVRGGNTIPISNDSSSGNHLTSLYIHAASLCRHPFSVIVSKLPVLTFNDHQTGDEGEMGWTGECHRWCTGRRIKNASGMMWDTQE